MAAMATIAIFGEAQPQVVMAEIQLVKSEKINLSCFQRIPYTDLD